MKTLPLVFLLAFSACSSKPRQKAAPETVSEYEGAFKLNGSSDDNSAGGLKTVFFALDSSQLSGAAKDILKNNAQLLKENKNVSVQVEGHADERGGRQYNLALGERRAKSVKDYLVILGVPANRIDTISYGNERPLSEERSERGWSRNRRGNFSITSR